MSNIVYVTSSGINAYNTPVDTGSFTHITGTNVQENLMSIDGQLGAGGSAAFISGSGVILNNNFIHILII
jgi:hypothetical protein